MLRPEFDIKLDSQVIYSDLNSSCDWISLPDTVKYNIDGCHEDFPDTIDGEKVTQKVKVFSLKSFGILYSLLCCMQVSSFQEKLPTQFFQGIHFLLDKGQIWQISLPGTDVVTLFIIPQKPVGLLCTSPLWNIVL